MSAQTSHQEYFGMLDEVFKTCLKALENNRDRKGLGGQHAGGKGASQGQDQCWALPQMLASSEVECEQVRNRAGLWEASQGR